MEKFSTKICVMCFSQRRKDAKINMFCFDARGELHQGHEDFLWEEEGKRRGGN